MPRYTLRLLLLIVLLGALSVTLIGCDGGRLISHSQEIDMGRQAADSFEDDEGGVVDDPTMTAFVDEIAARLEPVVEPPDYPYDVRVLDNDKVNAVAFPGGRLYLYRGLIDTFNWDADQVAWVLAHEMTHVARQHAVRRIERQLGYEVAIGLIIGDEDVAALAGAVAGLVVLDYGRDNEFEADRMGMDYVHAAGYDPTAAVAVLEEFQRIQGRDPNDFEIMFMTHPGSTDRIDHARNHLKDQGWSGAYYSP
jgi:predicted Zn-dependent protease